MLRLSLNIDSNPLAMHLRPTCRFLLALALTAVAAQAHFPFLLPAEDGHQISMILSETLELDPAVDSKLLLGGQYRARLIDTTELPLPVTEGLAGPLLVLPDVGQAAPLVYGCLDLGRMQRGSGPAHLLLYYPKLVRGNVRGSAAALGEAVPLELVPHESANGLRVQFLVEGKPLPQAPLTVIDPVGAEHEFETDAQGFSPELREPGRYGCWARHWLEQAGERDGEPYTQVRRYATLVADLVAVELPEAGMAEVQGVAFKAGPAESEQEQVAGREGVVPVVPAEAALRLPEATSSFGATELDGWVYVYGGHTAPTHEYSTQAVSGRFFRLDLARDTAWQELSGGRPLQGMNLAVHAGFLYRVGGMEPRNAPGEPVDNWSIAEVVRYDPACDRWQPISPLPEARSSHDVVVSDGKLYVVGGWQMLGQDGNHWPDKMWVLDLQHPDSPWQALPQPFQRRALIAAVHRGRIFVVGGFDENDVPSRRVDIYDPQSGSWSLGPGLPGPAIRGFAPAACVQDRQLYVSVGDGSLLRLNDEENLWESVAETMPRIVHRMLAHGSELLLLGGAADGHNLDEVEVVSLDSKRKTSPPLHSQRPAAAPPAVRSASAGTAAAASSSNPAAQAAVQAALALQSHCPVMPENPVDAASTAVEYAGQTVLLCCKSCVRRFKANPGKYASSPLLPQLAAAGSRAPD